MQLGAATSGTGDIVSLRLTLEELQGKKEINCCAQI